jgi:hypothetical protein
MLRAMALVPSFVPHESAQRKRAWPRVAVTLLILAVYLGSAALQDGPIQVWLLVLFPFALAAVATALRIIDPSERG